MQKKRVIITPKSPSSSPSLCPASDEQALITRDVAAGQNVTVDAVAGSGKTTTILHISGALKDKQILVITYNSLLKIETRQRISALGIQNVEMHTYHSAAGTYFNVTGDFERAIRTVGDGSATLRQPIKHDILIIDEVQDMNIGRYKVVQRFIASMDNPQLVILGDVHQCIYNFGSCPADPRFLTMAEKIYQNRGFINRTLGTSYRVTREIADFINHSIGYPRIRAVKSGEKVQYVLGNPYDTCEHVYDYIMHWLSNGYRAQDVFILAHSVKQGAKDKPVNLLANMLSMKGIPVFRPLNDDNELDQNEINDKVVVSSFHQSKGRERKIVVCYGYDDNYFKYSGKDRAIGEGQINPERCPNEWYVALSRSQEKLIVVGGDASPPWMTRPPPTASVDIIGDFKPSIYKRSSPYFKVSVTDLVKFKTSGQLLYQLEALYRPLITEVKKGSEISLALTVHGNGANTVEAVSDITSLAISLIYESQITGKSPCRTTSDWLKYATVMESKSSGYINRLNQISSYDWLTEEQRAGLLANYELFLGRNDKIILERPIERDHASKYGNIHVHGRIDAECTNCIWEFKLTSELKPEHILQLIAYSSIINKGGSGISYKLLNIRTGQCISFHYDKKTVDTIMELLFETHYGITKVTDKSFLAVIGCADPVVEGDDEEEQSLTGCLL